MSGRTPENLSAVAAEFRGVAERFSNIVSRVGVTDVAVDHRQPDGPLPNALYT